MGIRIITAIILLALLSCQKENLDQSSDSTTYVFGHFYGFCGGEECVEIFKWDGSNVYEDRLDNYPLQDQFYDGDFERLGPEKAADFEGRSLNIPDSLFLKNTITYGIPDAYDQGGIYFEIRTPEFRQFWILDQDTANIPHLIHPMHQKIKNWIDLAQE